jgi:hypothetical protein
MMMTFVSFVIACVLKPQEAECASCDRVAALDQYVVCCYVDVICGDHRLAVLDCPTQHCNICFEIIAVDDM